MKMKEVPGLVYRIFTTGTQNRIFVNRKVKDRLFRFIFSNDREALLQLYNALNGTQYLDAGALEIITVENIIYMSMKNDLAFIMVGTLNLYEHQSTPNRNMPLRMLLYLSQEYQKLVTGMKADIYGSRLIKLPTPQCVVFYNGTKEEPEEQILRLSDSFDNQEMEAGVELKVKVLNINYGYNKELMDRCRKLWEYAYFVHQINQNLQKGMPLKTAVDHAVFCCIEEGILADILEQNRMEVMGMLLTEYNERKTMRYLRKEAREEGLEEGREEGREKGREEGREEGEQRMVELAKLLFQSGRSKDLERALEDAGYRKKLYKEFHI